VWEGSIFTQTIVYDELCEPTKRSPHAVAENDLHEHDAMASTGDLMPVRNHRRIRVLNSSPQQWRLPSDDVAAGALARRR